MKLFNHLTLTSLALGVLANGAVAADFTEPVVDWNGFYAGVHAGWGWSDLDYSIADGSDFSNPPEFEGYSIDADGPLAGVQAGFNWQIDNFVLGVEGDASWSGIDGGFNAIDTPGDTYFFNADSEINWLASLRGRVGLTWDKVLFYGTGGVAFTDVDTKVVSDWPGSVENYSDLTSHTGWVAGAGVEVMFTDNITGRLEYLHYEFGEKDFFVDSGDVGYDLDGSVDLDVDVVRAGINVLF